MPTETLPPLCDWLPSSQTISRMNTISVHLSSVERDVVDTLLQDVTRACLGQNLELAEIDVPRCILPALSDVPLDELGCGRYRGIAFCSTSGSDEASSLQLKFSGYPYCQPVAATDKAASTTLRTLPVPSEWLPKASMRKWLCSASINVGNSRVHALKDFLDQTIAVCHRRDFNLISVGLPGPVLLALSNKSPFVLSGVLGDYNGIGLYCQELYPLASMLELNFVAPSTVVS